MKYAHTKNSYKILDRFDSGRDYGLCSSQNMEVSALECLINYV